MGHKTNAEKEASIIAHLDELKAERAEYHEQDDVIGFCPDYAHPHGCIDL